MDRKIKRESVEMDVVFVGAGPASLAGALHLARLIASHDEAVARGERRTRALGEVQIAVIEKGGAVGAHILSGAVMDPCALAELMPDFLAQGAPLDAVVTEEEFLYLTEKRALRSPLIPPPLRNHGYYIVSLSKLVAWLGEKCEEAGINIFPGFPGVEVLYDRDDRVIGVRTGDKGIGRDGRPKSNFEPGVDLLAKVTVFGEGPRGSLTKQLVTRLGLDEGCEPQVYSLGIKELWELPDDRYPAGRVTHTLGYPSDVHTYGGGWIYGMRDRIISLGYVTGLDYRDPSLDPHAEFQLFKQHPAIARILEGGRMIRYGAKTIVAGGIHAMPRIYGDGFLLVGDSAGFLNAQRLKGIHTAIKSGMLAAEAIFEALLADDFSARQLRRYRELVEVSWLMRELRRVRNFHAGFRHGRWLGLANAGLQFLTGGRAWGILDRLGTVPGHEAMQKLTDLARRDAATSRYAALRFDGKLTFNKLTDVYHASVAHEEDQPPHLHVLDTNVCATRCAVEYGNPCEKFCPAAVYEMVDDGQGGRKLQINFTNCVHCKTCDIMDPYQIINWVPPEGGGGPDYTGM